VFFVAIVALLTTPAAATAAPSASGSCVFVARKAVAKDGVSKAVRTCGSAATLAKATAGTSLLAMLYEDADWKGGSDPVYGGQGPCDRDGYQIDLALKGWSFSLSSYRVYSQCTDSYYTNYDEYTSYGHVGDVAYVGDPWNDFTADLHLWAG
jgi:hypothetical protein